MTLVLWWFALHMAYFLGHCSISTKEKEVGAAGVARDNRLMFLEADDRVAPAENCFWFLIIEVFNFPILTCQT